MNNEELEQALQSYQPNWRGDVHPEEEDDVEDGYFYDPERLKNIPDDDIIDEDEGIFGKHLVKAIENLHAELHHSGPYTSEQVIAEIARVRLDEDIEHLISLGLLKKVGEDGIALTELGEQTVEENQQ